MSSTNLGFLDAKLEHEREYWLEKLSGDLVAAGVPLDFERPIVSSGEKEAVSSRLREDTASRLFAISGGSELLIFTVLVTAIKICLHKYTGLEDIVVGTPIHEQHRDAASLNRVLALRSRVGGAMPVKQLLSEVKRTLAEAYANQKYPFERILDLLNIETRGNRAPLFNVALVLEGINERENLSHLKHDLTVLCSIAKDEVSLKYEYDPRLFKRATVEVFREHCEAILRSMLDAPELTVSQLELLSAERKRAFIVDFNDTRADYPGEQLISRLFEEQVARDPARTAVTDAARSLSFRELNERANRLANYLRRAGAGRGALVGICLEHSPEALAAILAVLKAGAAYVPLDPAHPRSRLNFMLADAGAQVLLTRRQLAEGLAADALNVIALDADEDAIARESAENLTPLATAADLAYVIYTSGSTGEPKGVMIQHAALVNYIRWAADVYLGRDELAFPLYSSLAFDLTVTSIFLPLVTGNEIVVYRDHERDMPLSGVLEDRRRGILKLTPSHLSLLKESDGHRFQAKCLIVGGEAFDTELARQALKIFGEGVEIFNEYGPTEATVGCMIHKFDPATDNRRLVPIGTPAANAQIYVLDDALNPVSENMIGDLYISGSGLAAGYLNRHELTAERFVPNPFVAGQRMYKTGDLARRLPEGVLEFVGRNDEQVKFHGYRVELNELRSVLNRHPQVRDSVVALVKDENGFDILMAYYVSRQEQDASELREFLARSVIEETLPNIFVHLKKLPLTLNGKVNHHALPTLEEARQKLKRTFVAPRTPAEETVASIIGGTLGLAQIGIHDNFFELGGHSLMGMQVIARLREAFGLDVPLHVLFDMPTVAHLTLAITQMQMEQEDSDEMARLIDEIKLLSEDDVENFLAADVTSQANEESA
jgi:amino acid adenylation domain-containing protein